MRALLLRPGLPPVTLLLALLLSAALGSILGCHPGADAHRVSPAAVVGSAAVVEPAAAPLQCPGCVVGASSADVERHPAVPSGTAVLPAGWDPCTPDHSCQHGPVDGGVDGSAVRAPDAPRASGSAASPPCPWPPYGEPPAAAAVLDVGPAGAALASVAVLCVDRN